MTKIKAEKQVTDPPKNDKDYTWQHEMTKKYKGKPRTPGKVLPEGTFTKSPSEIANILKMHSEDYGEASRKLNSYINRQGKNLQGADKNRLYDAKEHLKNAYGEQNKKKTQAIAEQPIYSLPPGHNLDDGQVDLLKVVPDNREKEIENDPQFKAYPKINAAARLGSVLNSEQDPGTTRMSSVEEASSTLTDNLDETNISADSTSDSLDMFFEESKTPSNTAYAGLNVVKRLSA